MKIAINITRLIEAAAWVLILGVVGSLDIGTVSLGRGAAFIVAFMAAGFAARGVRAWIRRAR